MLGILKDCILLREIDSRVYVPVSCKAKRQKRLAWRDCMKLDKSLHFHSIKCYRLA